jgi:uncharacterized protein YjbI with pentapeptide repeats
MARGVVLRLSASGLMMLAGLFATVATGATPAVASTAGKHSTSSHSTAPAATSCTSFSDDFQTDSSLSSHWTTNTPLLAAVTSDLHAHKVTPQLTFTSSGMEMQGVVAPNQFTGIQSSKTCSAPFSFQTNVEGLVSHGNTFVVYLVSPNQSRAFSLEGNLNPNNRPYYGVWIHNRLGASEGHGRDIDASPGVDSVYDIDMSISAQGVGTITLSGAGVRNSVTASVGKVGTGPFYVVLGEREGVPTTRGPNDSVWLNSTVSSTSTVSAALSASSPTVASVETVPASAVSAASVASTESTTASAPLSSIPLSSIGLASSPLGSIPLSSIPLSSIAITSGTPPPGLAAAQQALESTLLANLSITYPANCGAPTPACTGWEGVLAGTSYENIPLEAVTLADVLENPTAAANFDSVDLGALNLSSTPLSSIPLSSIELGATPLSSIGLGGSSEGASAIDAWCAELTTIGSSCADFGISPGDTSTTVTLLSLTLAGVPLSSIPLSSIPLSSIDLSSSPLSSIPLSSINLISNPLSSIPLSSIPLSSIPLSSIPLSSIPDLPEIVDCSTYPDCANGTLGEAYDAGAILPSATVTNLDGIYNGTTIGQLLTGDNTSYPNYPDLVLGDLLVSTIPPATYQWQSIDLASVPLAADEIDGGTGGSETYTATIDVRYAPATVQLSVTLPPTFAYVPGSTELDGKAASDPSDGPPLKWTLPTLPVGKHTLSFKANAGIGLGPATATLSAAVEGTVVSASSATVDVIDGEQPQINSASTGYPLGAGTLNTVPITPSDQGDLNLGYLTSPGDLDYWAVYVPQGAELSLALTNLPAPNEYDLALFGPGSPQLQGTPSEDLSGVTDTLPTLTPGTTSEAIPGSQDLPETPPPGYQLEAISNNPDGQAQYIQTTPLAAGTYIVQVSGYNGASSSQPYLLQANILGGQTAPSCPGGIPYLNSLGAPASGPVAVPSGANTLFLVDTQRLSAAFGETAESQIMSQLQDVASDSSAGVVGAVIPVDAYTTVQDAYATWNTDPCSVDAANAVVAAISSVVDQIRANNPTVQNLVIVGADDQIPFARIPDGASQSNERDYGAATFAGENNVEADALSLGYYLSDDPYAAGTPLGVGSATLYLPQLGVGRLVESATEIEGALSRFVTSDGDLDASASLTTGYSFLDSGADAVSANLAANGLAASNLINETWTESDLDAALAADPTPGVDSINAHFDYSRALPAYDNTNDIQTNLFTTEDVRDPPDATSYAGRLLFSMGCHAGLDVDDAEVSISGIATPVDDWAKAFADSGALWVANTGYGYADTDTIAYSAKLMAEFAGNLNGSLTIGEALSEAKQQYAAGNAILSPYDLKALMESTLYGLPMYHLNAPSSPTPPPTGPPTEIDPVTGLTAAPVSVSLGMGSTPGQLSLGPSLSGNGSYYQVNGTTAYNAGIQTTEYRPIEPLVSVPVTEPNLVPHGALVTALQSTDIPGFTPTYSMPSAGSADATPPSVGDAAFPGTIQRVATYGTFTSTGTTEGAQLDLVAGQFLPNTAAPGTGTQRLFNSMSAQVFYQSPGSPLADDYTPPTIDSTQATSSDGAANFVVQVSPSSPADPVVEVLVLYTDIDDPGTWTPLTLTSSPDGLTWSGSGPATPNGAQYIVEAVDEAGNVAFSNDEGADFGTTIPPAVSISLSGTVVNGYYTGPVTADITAPSDSTYVLDGSPPAPVPASGALVVSASGEHTLTVTDPAGVSATQAFAISTSQTTTTLTSSANPSVVGQPVTFTASVAPATTGVGSPTGSVEFLQDNSPIASCGGSSGEPLSGSETATCQVTYTAPDSPQLTATYLGDPNFTGSTTLVPLTQTVTQAAAAVTLSASASSVMVGQPVTFTASVGATGPGSGSPTGFVEFVDGSTPIAGCGGATGVLLNNGSAVCTAGFAAGSDSITAIYLGDANFHGPVSSTPVTVQVGQAGTTTGLISSANPAVVGQTVTYTATVGVDSPGAGSPTGSVEFLDGTTPIAACGGSSGQPLSTTETATCTVAYPTVGSHQITASYLGDPNFTGSTSRALTESVKNPTVVALSSSQNPSVVGHWVTLTATVTVVQPGSGLPTGNVEFMSRDHPISACRGAGGKPISNTGTVTCSVIFGLAGSRNVVAVYLGTSLFAASTSPVVTQVVTPRPCTSLTGCDLSGLDLQDANFARANLQRANLSGTDLQGANLAGANLQGADLAGANLDGANLSQVAAPHANFLRAKLTNATGTGADLQGDNLAFANLTNASFADAVLRSADLTAANCSDAKLADANLDIASLAHANFTGADLARASLQGAVLTDLNFAGADLKGVRF